VVIAAFLLPPVVDQTIQRTPLGPWSALAFAGVVVAAAYLAYKRSPLSLAVLAFAVPFAAYRDIGNTTITIEKCLVFGTAVGLILSGVPMLPRSRGARRVFWAGCLLLAAVAISLWHAVYPMHVAREFFKQAEYLVLFWCAATLVEQTASSTRALAIGVGVAACIVSTLAVSQAIIGGAPSGIWINGHPLPRVAGPLEGPNQLAGYLEALLPVLWVTPLLGGMLRPAWNYSIAASSAALILTQSRAGVIVATLSYLALAKINPRLALKSLAPLLIGTVVGLLVVAGWFAFWAHASLSDVENFWRFAIPQNAGGVGTRSQLWPAAIALFERYPLTGNGAGNFEFLLPTVGLFNVQTQAGSLWLQTLAEQGLVGFAALVGFAFFALRETYRLSSRSPLALAAFLALASLLAHQLVDDLFFYPKAAALAWLLLGAGTTAVPQSHAAVVESRHERMRVAMDAKQPVAEPT
jgi:O-antigen ligase